MLLAAALAGIAVLLGTSAASVAGARATGVAVAAYGASAAASALLLAVGLGGLLGAPAPETLTLPLGVPWLGAHFRLDPLAAFFLVAVNLSAAAASVYAIGATRKEEEPQRVVPFYPAFLAGMNVVLLADDAFTFLLGWEFMSLASWALVVAHHRHPDNLRAGYIYLLMASAGMLTLLLAFGLLAGPAGGYGFDAIRANAPAGGAAALVLMLALAGAGSKAGLVPLHVWLPLAHPAAPSHVSALMSGAMTKVAVYGFIRIAFDLAGPGDWWWGAPVLVVGGITAVAGILHAVVQDDLKRALAYSTIENIGIVFAGLGLALAFKASGFTAAAALALTASLFHVLNHALMKTLLFLGAGAILGSTGTRAMDRLGGLIHRMPRTSVAMLAGCMAISALPPLNGFASEWLLLQAILLSPDLPQWLLKLVVPAVGAMLALAAALTAAAFVRIYGVTFLGRPRSDAAADAHEADGFSTAAMLGLAALCLAAGVLPGPVVDGLGSAVDLLIGGRMPQQAGNPWLSIVPIAESRSSYNGLLVLVFMAGSALLAASAIHRFASRGIRRSPAWDCGFPDASPATQYTAASFAQPLRRVFGPALFRSSERVDMPPPGDMRPARLSLTLHDLAFDWLYAPLARLVGAAADWLNRFQFLTIRRYLGLVFAALVGLLLVVAIWQ